MSLMRFAHEAARQGSLTRLAPMFANGEQGGYWDPRLGAFEDSTATTPATVDGLVGALLNQVSGQPSAIQATSGNKPYLRLTPNTGKYWLDANVDVAALNATFGTALGSACSIARLDPELGVQWLHGQTVGTTVNITPPLGYGGPVFLLNRMPTAAEIAIVEQLMLREMPQLGPELVANGTFDSDLSGWVNDSSFWIWDDGKARHALSSNFNILAHPVGASAGDRAFFRVDIGVEAGNARLQYRRIDLGPINDGDLYGTGSTGSAITSNVSLRRIIAPPADAFAIGYARDTVGLPSILTIDNVSLRVLL